jgi:iron complex transport system substrate-binding protein
VTRFLPACLALWAFSATAAPAPSRVLSLCTTATDTMVRLGLGSSIAGIDEYSAVVPGTRGIPIIGKGAAISKEEVLARGIDLAFVWWFQDSASRALAELGIPAVTIRCDRAADVPGTIRMIGARLGAGGGAERLAAGMEERLRALPPPGGGAPPTVYFELYSPLRSCGRDSYIDDLIGMAGGRNIAADASGPLLLSAERLLADDPDFVVLLKGICTPGQFAARGGLGTLAAVRLGRVVELDRYSLVAGAGLPEGVAALRSLLGTGGEKEKGHP